MENSFLEESSSILSAKMARVDLDETTPKRDSSTEEDNIIVPSVHGKTFRLALEPGRLFCCSETGIQFQVKSPVTIEYQLEYGHDYMKQIKDSGYELVGPLFNITVEPGVVSSVHLPHYLYLEDLGGDKSSIKYGHFRDGKIHFLKPTRIELSYIVFENPTFSRAGAMFRISSIWPLRKKLIPISGKVLLYFCVLNPHKEDLKEYRTHLFLVPSKRADLNELDKVKKVNGFKRIDKPSNTKLIAGNIYTMKAKVPDAKLIPKVIPLSLQFEMNNEIKDLDFMEINVGGSATSISLTLDTTDQTCWIGELTRADLEHLSVMVKWSEKTGHAPESSHILGQVIKTHTSDDSEQHFVVKHSVDLIERIRSVEPIIDYLKQKKILSPEDCDTVNSEKTPQMKMRALYNYIVRLGDKEKDEFLIVLKKRNASIIKNLEAKS